MAALGHHRKLEKQNEAIRIMNLELETKLYSNNWHDSVANR